MRHSVACAVVWINRRRFRCAMDYHRCVQVDRQ